MNIEKLIDKKVLVFDVETTGLPERKSYYAIGIDEYYEPDDIEKYNECRIVSIAWTYLEKFNFDSLNSCAVTTYIRKPIDFINIPNSNFHGVTYENAKKNGKLLSKIMNDELSDILEDVDYIVGHNVTFDIFVLMSELSRIKFLDNFNILKKILDEKRYLCTGELGRDICKLYTKQKEYKYKMPKLKELYEKLYGDDNVRQHAISCRVDNIDDINFGKNKAFFLQLLLRFVFL